MGLSFADDDDDEEEEDDGLSFTDDEDEEPEKDLELECMYDGCTEVFPTHEDRTAHSMEEHWDINPEKYPTITGRGRFEWQA